MSDLISREVVIDVLKQTGIIQDNDLGHLVVDEINRIPTAYSIEKVVAELEELPNREADYYYAHSNDVIDRENAIDIVKRGGVE